MKKKYLFFLSFLFLFGLKQSNLQCQSQLQKWYMNYYEIDFSGATPQTNSLPFSFSSNPLANSPYLYANLANGIHDKSGNLLFYSVWDDTNPVSAGEKLQIFNNSGNLIGDLICERDGYELSIVPFSTSPDKFLIIYPARRGAGATRYLDFVILDIADNGGQGSMSIFFEIAAPGAGTPTPICAISQEIAGNRFLYTNINKNIQKYVIDFSASIPELIVTPATIPIIHSFPQEINLTELELSHNGNQLALAESWTNKVHLIDLNASGDFSGIQTFSIGNSAPFDDFMTGAEFSADNSKLFVNFNHPSTCMNAADEGIYVIDLNNNTVSGMPILNSENYNRSHLELGFDGFIYVGSYIESAQENRIARIDPVTEAISGEFLLPDILPYSGDYRGYQCNPAYPGIFTLPDQIDGETTIIVNTNENLVSNKISIFPNPTSESLTLSAFNLKENKIVSILIYDNLGQEVIKKQKVDIFFTPKLDISNLSSGIYFISIHSEIGTQFIGKFSKI